MFDLFGPARYLIRFSAVNIDNIFFKLHYKITVVLLVSFSLMVTAKQYIGDPIYCTSTRAPLSVVNSFCWIHSTLTDTRKTGIVGKHLISPGVGHLNKREDTDWTHHKYYQWVCFVLFLQAMFFYGPHWLWKAWEGGIIRRLSYHLETITLNKDEQLNQVQLLLNHFSTSYQGHNFYALKFALCEVLNFLNIIGQIFLTDMFLDGKFMYYGWEVVTYLPMPFESSMDPMSRIFPKIAKCIYLDYGPSGTIQNMDSICILPLNIVNDKIYIVLWFWFMILAFVTLFSLIYRLAILLIKPLRVKLLCARCYYCNQKEVKYLSSNCTFGDWFVLNQLAKNIDPQIFNQIIIQLVSMKGKGKV